MKFTRSIRSKVFHQSQGDHTLFFKHRENGKITALVVYVDDILLRARRLKELLK